MVKADKLIQEQLLGQNVKQINVCEELLKPHKTVRIAVSGDVLLTKLETEIIDTREFQRLRSIKELGMTYMVYPTALHTRFDHSLGTVFMADQIIQNVRENKHSEPDESRIDPEQELIIRLYALLHDITHIPFGHTLEDEFCIITKHDETNEAKNRFVGEDSKIGKIIQQKIGNDNYQRLMKLFLIKKTELDNLKEDRFLYEIVNNTVCADLLDYLARDCYFCNIILDMDYRFLKYLYVARNDSGSTKLAIRLWKNRSPINGTPRKDILSELVRLMENRYLLGERVYFHHTKLICDAMISGAIQRALSDKKIDLNFLFENGDESVLDKLENSGIESVLNLVRSLRERKLWKLVYEVPRGEVELAEKKDNNQKIFEKYSESFWKNQAFRSNTEKAINEFVSAADGEILILCPDPKMALKTAEMNVSWKGEIIQLKDITGEQIIEDKLNLILSSHRDLWSLRVYKSPRLTDDSILSAACEYYLSPDSEKRKLSGGILFEHSIDKYAKENEWLKPETKEYIDKKEIAVKELFEFYKSGKGPINKEYFESIVNKVFVNEQKPDNT